MPMSYRMEMNLPCRALYDPEGNTYVGECEALGIRSVAAASAEEAAQAVDQAVSQCLESAIEDCKLTELLTRQGFHLTTDPIEIRSARIFLAVRVTDRGADFEETPAEFPEGFWIYSGQQSAVRNSTRQSVS